MTMSDMRRGAAGSGCGNGKKGHKASRNECGEIYLIKKLCEVDLDFVVEHIPQACTR